MAYGYPGDSTPDTASLLGEGAFSWDEAPGSLVPLKDAALKKADAENIYHVKPGEEFINPADGKTYRYADVIPAWSPAKPGYVDVYDPDHPPDVNGASSSFTMRSGHKSPAADIPPSIVDEPTDSVDASQSQTNADAPTSETAKLSPLDQFKVQFPEFKDAADSDLLTEMHKRMAPDMDPAKFAALAKLPTGEEAINAEVNKGLTGLEQLRKDFPDKSVDDGTLMQMMYERLASNGKIDSSVTTFDDFTEQMNPGSTNWAYNLWKGLSRGASAAGHAASGQAYGQVQNARDFSDQIYKAMDAPFIATGVKPGTAVKSWAKAADDWMLKNTPVEGYWKNFVNWMSGQAQLQSQAATRDAQRAQQAAGTSGKVGRILGEQATGTAIAMGTLYMPGAPLKSAIMLAGAYEGLSHVGAAVQAGHDQALLEGIQGFGTGALMRYMMDSPAGRKTMAFNMWLANTGEDTVQKWLRGEKVDLVEQGLRTVLDLGFGAAMGKEPEAPRTTGLAGDVSSRHEVSARDILGSDTGGGGSWFARDPIAARGAPSAFTPKTMFEATGRLPKQGSPEEMKAAAEKMKPAGGGVHLTADDTKFTYNSHSAAIREEVTKGMEAHANGDTQKAAEHYDAALSIMAPKQRTNHAKTVIKTVHDAANNNGAQGKSPQTEQAAQIIYQSVYGLSNKRGQAGFTLNPAVEIHDWFKDHWPEIQKKLMGPASKVARVARGIEQGVETHITDVFRPSKKAQKMDAISAYRTSESQQLQTAFPTELSRSLEIEKVLKGGEKVGRRESVFEQFSDGQKKDMLVNEEEGKRNTGNVAADFILGFHQTAYKAMEAVEKAAGIKYAAIEHYIFHALKDQSKENQARFQRFYDTFGQGDPRFAKKRGYPTLRDALEAGYELKTYNPERLFQARLYQHVQAIRKIMTLRDAEDAGLAFRSNTPELSTEVKGWTQIVSPARDENGVHETYLVEPKSAKLLGTAWDPRSIYDAAFVGPLFRLAAVGKGATAKIKLALSVAHFKHIIKMNLTHSLAQMTRMALNREGSPEAWSRAVGDAFRLGGSSTREVRAWRGEKLDSPLTADEKANIEDAKAMGLDFSMNSEREMQFQNTFAKLVPKWAKANKGVNAAVDHGWEIINSTVFQKHLFESTIPRIKFNAAMALRDNILREHPELSNPGNELARKVALRQAGEAIDARFGEMNYSNLYWNKMAKDIGQASLLSMGWQIGFMRVYNGAWKDFTSNVAHMGEIVKKIKGEPSEHQFLTDRILFAGYYTALNALEAGVYTYIAMKLGGASDEDALPKGRDYVFPRTGKDANGRDMRVQPIEYSREWFAWDQKIRDEGGYPAGLAKGSADFWWGKAQPFFQTLSMDWQNKNYFGMEIRNPQDPQGKQLADRVRFFVTNLGLPIPFEGAFENTGGEYKLSDVGRSMAGYPRAPAWTTRSDTENHITDAYHLRFGGTKSKEDVEKQNAHQALRQAYLKKDMPALKDAVTKLRAQHVTDAAIVKMEKEAHLPYETYMFKRLGPEDQRLILNKMSKEELKVYAPVANKAIRNEYEQLASER